MARLAYYNQRTQSCTVVDRQALSVRSTLGLDSNRAAMERAMLWTLFVILLVLWVLGLVTSYTLGGFIHILLVLAIVVLVINLVQGRRIA